MPDPDQAPAHKRIGGWVWGIATAVVIAVASTGAIAISQRWWEGDPAPTATEVRLFTPENLGQFEQVKRDHGSCNVDSNVNPIREAHRCFGETEQPGPEGVEPETVTYIYDPCWGLLNTKLHCASDPWTDEVTVFTVNKWTYLPRRGKIRTWRAASAPPKIPALFQYISPVRSTKTDPWAIELSNGSNCTFVSGANFFVAGERANYLCSEESFPPREGERGWVIGVPDRRQSPWIVRFMEDQGRQAHEERVHVAWY